MKLMTYNVLNYPGSTGDTRDPYFISIVDDIHPDILVVQEVLNLLGANRFRDSIIQKVDTNYSMATFINGPDSDNALFYRKDLFKFTSNIAIATELRNINEYSMVHLASGVSFKIYSVHLKSSTGTVNQNKRAAEIDSLRKVTDSLADNSFFFVVGDFNIYRSSEPAYIRLLTDEPTNNGHFIDVYEDSLSGTWNNSSYAKYHTQSPRTRSFGGGATGGLDDRFDMILFSNEVDTGGVIEYIENSITPIGNDGNHYNDSINAMPNTAVSAIIADALHYSSDHLPLLGQFSFPSSFILSADLYTWSAQKISDQTIRLNWSTSNNESILDYHIELSYDGVNWNEEYVVRNSDHNYYNYDHYIIQNGNHYFRLRSTSVNNKNKYSSILSINISASNYVNIFPNPAKDWLIINGATSHSNIVIYDVWGRVVKEKYIENVLPLKLDISNLVDGVYYLDIPSNQDSPIKFIKGLSY